MDSMIIPWFSLASLAILSGYMFAAGKTGTLPDFPLALFITYFVITALAGFLEGFERGLEWMGYLSIAADVTLSWAVARLIFWTILKIAAKTGTRKKVLPRITQDFIMFMTFGVLFFLVLRIRGNIDLASILTTSAVVTVVIGLAVQATLNNFFSGLIIQAEQPFSIGDWIQLDTIEGQVIGISWKSTQVLTRDNVAVYIPNSILASSTFMNFSKPERKKVARIRIGLEYGAAPGKVREAVMAVLSANPDVMDLPAPDLMLAEFGDSSIIYEIRFWHNSFGAEPKLKSDLRQQLWYALRRKGIRIPFPILDLHHAHIERDLEKEKANLEKQEIMALFDSISILEPLSTEERELLTSRVTVRDYGLSEVVLSEGDPGGSMYIIRSGTCQATVMDSDGRKTLLSTMTPGQFFGEISLLTGEKRTATVTAVTDVCLIVINKDAFSAVICANPKISEEIAAIVVERQVNQGVLMDSPCELEETSRNLISRISRFFCLPLFQT